MTLADRFRGCLLGLAVGDAVGAAVEFSARGSFEPVVDMIGGGPFQLKPGQWTDDTSMALCLATSLLDRGGFDPHDQMMQYCRWADSGYMSSTGDCFDIGGTISYALNQFKKNGDPFAGPTSPRSAGNGCIMRLAPIAMFYYPELDAVARFAADSARTTHGAVECIEASRLFGRMLCRSLMGLAKSDVLLGDSNYPVTSIGLAEIARGAYASMPASSVVGSGYVVRSLEAALWSFNRTDSYAEAVLAATNMGDDADTTAAICGQLAGAHYGVHAIPESWLNRLAWREEITDLADRLVRRLNVCADIASFTLDLPKALPADGPTRR